MSKSTAFFQSLDLQGYTDYHVTYAYPPHNCQYQLAYKTNTYKTLFIPETKLLVSSTLMTKGVASSVDNTLLIYIRVKYL